MGGEASRSLAESRRPGAQEPRLRLLPEGDLRYLREGFGDLLVTGSGVEATLSAVVDDLLAHSGSLARGQIAFGLLRACGTGRPRARAVAVALEYFHTASLVFDDLPSMDDAAVRRGRPCPHRAYGEGPAVLGALALINRAYALLWEVMGTLPPARAAAAGELVSSCLGVTGVLDGQARDLRFPSDARNGAAVLAVAAGKTVPLVRLALVLPALLGGAGEDAVERLDRLAESWGLAYQVLDDFKDGLLSRGEAGKSTARDRTLGRPNLPRAVGAAAAMAYLDGLLAEARGLVEALAGDPVGEAGLDRLQTFLEAERQEMRRRLAAAA